MNKSQKKAVKNYRERLARRGVKRFEVQGLEADRDLLRALAKKLAANDADAERVREQLRRFTFGEGESGRSILEALMRSPLGELDLRREFVEPRKVDL